MAEHREFNRPAPEPERRRPGASGSGTPSLGMGILHLLSSKVITTGVALLASMMLARFRTLHEYGTYSQMLTVITLATSLFMVGLPDSSSYFLARADSGEERRVFLSVFYSVNTAICAAIGLLLVFSIPLIERYFHNESIRGYAYFLALYPWAHITVSGLGNALVVYGRTKKLMVVNILVSLVSLVSIVAVQLAGASFDSYLKLFLAGYLLLALLAYRMVGGLEPGVGPMISIPLIRRILAYSIPIGLAKLVATLDIELDKFVIGYVMDPDAFALYTNAGKELPLTMVPAAITSVLMPQLARMLKVGEKKAAVELWGVTVELSYLAMCFFATTCLAFAPQIISLLYSEKYLPGAGVFRVYALVLLLRVTYFGIVLNSSGKTRLVFAASVIGLLVNTVMNFLLYRLIGFVGPAAATLLSIGAVNFFQLAVTARFLDVPLSAVFPWNRLLEITLANAVWGVGAAGVIHLCGWGTDVPGILCSIAFGAVIAVAYLLFYRRRIRSLWALLNAD